MRSRPVQRSSAAAALVLAVALTGAACGDEADAARAEQAEEASARLAMGDYEGALFHARSALDDARVDPALAYVAAQASLALEHRRDALGYAEAGLAADPDDPALAAELAWVKGLAHAGLYWELERVEDWGAANAALEHATRAGSRRADAAFALVKLQSLGGQGTDARLLQFARLLLQLEPAGARADEVRAILDERGLSP